MTQRILVIDDEPGIREALKQVLEYEGHTVRSAGSGGEAITVYPDFRPHLVFLDVKMAGLDGLETLTRLRDLDPGATIVMISGHGTISTAVQATQRGAGIAKSRLCSKYFNDGLRSASCNAICAEPDAIGDANRSTKHDFGCPLCGSAREKAGGEF